MAHRTILRWDECLLPDGASAPWEQVLLRCRERGARLKFARVHAPWALWLRAWRPVWLLREAESLRTLRRLGIDAVRPLAWGARWLGPREVEAFLATEVEPGAMDLERWALQQRERGAPPVPWRVLGRAVGRMHARRFVHRDLFLRNVLRHASDPERLTFLDCRKGRVCHGPFATFSPRGVLYDLACLQLDVLAHGGADDWCALLGAWVEACGRRLRTFATRAIAARRRRLARALLAKSDERLAGRLAGTGRSRAELERRWLV